MKKILQLADLNAVDSFLDKNKNLINKDKVIVTGFENNERFKKFKDVLLKYGISKFHVNGH